MGPGPGGQHRSWQTLPGATRPTYHQPQRFISKRYVLPKKNTGFFGQMLCLWLLTSPPGEYGTAQEPTDRSNLRPDRKLRSPPSANSSFPRCSGRPAPRAHIPGGSPAADPVPPETYLEEAQAASPLTGGCGVGRAQCWAWPGRDSTRRSGSPGPGRAAPCDEESWSWREGAEPGALPGAHRAARSLSLAGTTPPRAPNLPLCSHVGGWGTHRGARLSRAGLSWGPVPACAKHRGSVSAQPCTPPLTAPSETRRFSSPANPHQRAGVGSNRSAPARSFALNLEERSCCSPLLSRKLELMARAPACPHCPLTSLKIHPWPHPWCPTSDATQHPPARLSPAPAPAMDPPAVGPPQPGRRWLAAGQSGGNAPVLSSARSAGLPPVTPSTLASPRRASPLRHRRVLPRVGAGRGARMRPAPARGANAAEWGCVPSPGGAQPLLVPGEGDGTEQQGLWWPFLLLGVPRRATPSTTPQLCRPMGQGPRHCPQGPDVALHDVGVPIFSHRRRSSPSRNTAPTGPVSPVGSVPPQPAGC